MTDVHSTTVKNCFRTDLVILSVILLHSLHDQLILKENLLKDRPNPICFFQFFASKHGSFHNLVTPNRQNKTSKFNKTIFQFFVSKDFHHLVISNRQNQTKQTSFSVFCFQRWFLSSYGYIWQIQNKQTKETYFSEFCFKRWFFPTCRRFFQLFIFFFFNVVLVTLDIFSDFVIAKDFFDKGHVNWGRSTLLVKHMFHKRVSLLDSAKAILA